MRDSARFKDPCPACRQWPVRSPLSPPAPGRLLAALAGAAKQTRRLGVLPRREQRVSHVEAARSLEVCLLQAQVWVGRGGTRWECGWAAYGPGMVVTTGALSPPPLWGSLATHPPSPAPRPASQPHAHLCGARVHEHLARSAAHVRRQVVELQHCAWGEGQQGSV